MSSSLPATLSKRVRTLSHCKMPTAKPGGVVYWMSRDQRVQDNWALLEARRLAVRHRVGLSVIFCLVPTFHEATIRQYGFMLRGLAEVETELRGLGIPFHCLQGHPVETLPSFVQKHDACALVADFSPLRVGMQWKQQVSEKLPEDVPLYEVDTHNIVPVWIASDKQEVGARTIRKKITEKLPTWLTDIPRLEALPEDAFEPASAAGAPLRHTSASLLDLCAAPTDWRAVRAGLAVDMTVPELDWCAPGYTAGMAMLDDFCRARLRLFADRRNDPNVAALSDLSPYFHFGQISPQRAAYVVKGHSKSQSAGAASFLEESVVRRELSDNFCFYNPNYDSLDGAANWARESLELHASDKRDHIYTLEQLEEARSHEDIWNAAQRQMVKTGKMHGFFRMYWAKKILEWSPTPAEALRRAIYLNDRYSIDGRDPNGYVGCGWAIMGTHDMGWAERPIFGKIRFMNYAGCKRKFDIAAYVAKWGSSPLKKGSLVAGGGGGGGASKRSLEAASSSSSSSASSLSEAELLKHRVTLQDNKAAKASVVGSLSELARVSCPREVLEKTQIGVAVGLLRKSADAEIAGLAEEIVAKWKAELKPKKQKAK